MAERWTVGLVVAAVLCGAAPVLIGAGIAGTAWGAMQAHWGWVVGGVGLVALAIARRLRRSCVSLDTQVGMMSTRHLQGRLDDSP